MLVRGRFCKFGNHFEVGKVLDPRLLQPLQDIVEERPVALPDRLKLHTHGAGFRNRVAHLAAYSHAQIAKIEHQS